MDKFFTITIFLDSPVFQSSLGYNLEDILLLLDVLTGVLWEQGAAPTVDDLFNDGHVGWSGRRRDQTDARHHGVKGRDEAQAVVEPLDAQWLCNNKENLT